MPDPGGLTPSLGREAARRDVAGRLRAAGVESADLDARLLVCAAAGIEHAALIRDPDAPLGDAAGPLHTFLDRRLAREPVSRILGRREFWGLSFALSPDVLDPRPETEGLVGAVLDAVGMLRGSPLALLDLGVGSGAILAALLRELPHAFGIGIDRSAAACRIAARNLDALGVAGRSAIVCGDWVDAVRGRFDLVVSNPPYVAHGDLDDLDTDVRAHDPIGALDGGRDGLDAYRAIVPQLESLVKPGGMAAFECGLGQGARLADMMRGAGLQGVAVYDDLAGRDRIVIAHAAVR